MSTIKHKLYDRTGCIHTAVAAILPGRFLQTLLSFFYALRGLFSRMSVCLSVSVLQSATKSAQCMGLDWRGSWCAPAAPMTSRAQSIMSLNITANSLSEHHDMIMVTSTQFTTNTHVLFPPIDYTCVFVGERRKERSADVSRVWARGELIS